MNFFTGIFAKYPELAVYLAMGLGFWLGSIKIRGFVREEPLLFKPGQFYVIASLLGVAGFTLLTLFFNLPLVPSALAGILITFVFRLLAILFDWKTRSVMPPPPLGD